MGRDRCAAASTRRPCSDRFSTSTSILHGGRAGGTNRLIGGWPTSPEAPCWTRLTMSSSPPERRCSLRRCTMGLTWPRWRRRGAVWFRPSPSSVAACHSSLSAAILPLGAPTVTIDQLEGARMATRRLLDLGHRTVHHVTGPQTWVDATARMRGWSEALRYAPRTTWPIRGRGLERPPRLRRGNAAWPATLTSPPSSPPTTAALGVIRGLHDAGRRVPEDVSVVGFDDTPESGYFLPPLTTVRQDFGEVGRRSVELLLALADGAPADPHVIVPAELVVRASTAPPPGQRFTRRSGDARRRHVGLAASQRRREPASITALVAR